MHTTTSTILQWQTNKTNFSFEKRVWPGLTISDALLANQNATKKLADDKNSIIQCKIFSLGNRPILCVYFQELQAQSNF